MAHREVEAAIVGGGAAGIAAARRLRDAGVDALILEARSRLGGRAWTLHSGGFPLDLGCGWLHSADRNPWRRIAEQQGRAIDKTMPPWARSTTPRGLPSFEGKAFFETLQRYRRRAETVGETQEDRAAATYLEPGDRWNPLLDAVSTYYSGAELDRISARDLQRYDDSGVNWRVAEGYGRVIADYGRGSAVELDCRVERIDRRGKLLRLETTQGAILARTAIVTLPSNLIAARPEFFLPHLPEKTEAATGLPLGLADKLFLSLEKAEEFDPESRAFGNADRTATGAYHLRPFGRPVIEAYFGGACAAELETDGEAGFFDFARAELVGLFGADFARRIAPLHIHCWGADPLARGSYSYAAPGKADCRAALAAPIEERLFFAGEACSRCDFSTAHGAYLTGVAAADEALAAIAGAKLRLAEMERR